MHIRHLAILAVVGLLASPLAAAAQQPTRQAPATAAWAGTIDYSVIQDPGRAMRPSEERRFFTRYMVESFKTWSPGPAPFDIAVPAPFYAQDDRLFAFDVFPPTAGDRGAGFVGWAAYGTELTKIMANTAEFNVRPKPETLRYGRNGDVAWMSMQVDVSGRLKGGQPIAMPVRNSLVLERRGGKWLIVHEHVSTPFIAPAG
jgi:ketosteroid isomerase-like protein